MSEMMPSIIPNVFDNVNKTIDSNFSKMLNAGAVVGRNGNDRYTVQFFRYSINLDDKGKIESIEKKEPLTLEYSLNQEGFKVESLGKVKTRFFYKVEMPDGTSAVFFKRDR